MSQRSFVHRVTGLFVRWGLVRHPYGREYATEQYTLTGQRMPPIDAVPAERRAGLRAALMALMMILLSLLATGLLFGPF